MRREGWGGLGGGCESGERDAPLPPTEIWSLTSSFAGKMGADGPSAAMGAGVASDTAMVGKRGGNIKRCGCLRRE